MSPESGTAPPPPSSQSPRNLRLPGVAQHCFGVQVQQSEHIQLVIQLEQWLMEGAYNKVLNARTHVPDQAYSYFMEKLLSTVR
jgi:hypothetical protein